MNIFHAQSLLKEYLQPFAQKKQTIGFVPTMGALHNGHLSLLKKSLQQMAEELIFNPLKSLTMQKI